MIREVAQVEEERCIGCARCLPPCPFDAILGAKGQMHTVLTEFCTGCELCVPACPVDCIIMVPRSAIRDVPAAPRAHVNRQRVQAHHTRLARREADRAALLISRKRLAHVP
jgi:Na+-translocating ferredoxin:NAD+ oxidoreductase subunit B